LLQALYLPGCQVIERTSVPPERHASRPAAFGDFAPQTQMRALDIDRDVIELKSRDFRDP
jgi:hypothetical protein